MKHKYIIWLIAVLVSLTAQPQSLKDLTLGRPDNTNLHQQAREFILAGKINEAIATYNALVIQQQNARNQGTQVNPEVMAEYAYALALGGAQAEALKNIDIALALSQSNTNTYFYVPQILRTIGLPALAAAYKYPFGAPKWIGTDAERLTAKYSLPCLLSCGANPTKFIADLLAQNRYIEAVAYASLNASQNPESQVACMLLSTAMEKCGLYQSSLTELRRVGQIEGASLPKGYMEQLAYLENKARKKGNNPTFAQPLSSMLYGGIGYGNSGTSVNGRYGIASGPLSFSADLRLFFPKNGDATTYYGCGAYYRYKALFMGLGFGVQDDRFSLSPTLGLSFINRKQTSSFDITLSYVQPFSKGGDSTFTFSVGKTYYFNLKSKKK